MEKEESALIRSMERFRISQEMGKHTEQERKQVDFVKFLSHSEHKSVDFANKSLIVILSERR